MKLTGDNLEYAISQYLDGTLSDLDRRVLEDQLAADAEARLLLEEYRHLKEVIARESAIHFPVNFDKLASHLSNRIEQEQSYVAQPMRIINPWVKRLAIAAGLVLMALVGYQFIPGSDQSQIANENRQSDNGLLMVSGPSIEQSKSSGMIHISVGPTDQLKQSGQMMSLVDETFATPAPKVVISSSSRQPANSTDERLY